MGIGLTTNGQSENAMLRQDGPPKLYRTQDSSIAPRRAAQEMAVMVASTLTS